MKNIYPANPIIEIFPLLQANEKRVVANYLVRSTFGWGNKVFSLEDIIQTIIALRNSYDHKISDDTTREIIRLMEESHAKASHE